MSPPEPFPALFTVLGLPPDPDLPHGEVQKAYHRLSKELHPDRNPDADRARYLEVVNAYEHLRTPEKFRDYINGNKGTVTETASEPQPASFDDWGDDDSSLGKPTRGTDIQARLTISHDEAYFGGRQTIKVRKDNGREYTYTVALPANVKTGRVVRLKGRGNSGTLGAPNGDVLVTITVTQPSASQQDQPDQKTRQPTTGPAKRGSDVRATVNLQPDELNKRTSRTLTLNTPSGFITRTFVIPAGTIDGQQLTFTGQGAEGVNGGAAGRLIITVHHVGSNRNPQRGADVRVTVDLDPDEVRTGVTKTLTLRTSAGSFSRTVEIPRGTLDGQTLTKRGLGASGTDGGSAGDLLITIRHVNVQPAPVNLYANLDLVLLVALRGDEEVQVPVMTLLREPMGHVQVRALFRGVAAPTDGQWRTFLLPKAWKDPSKPEQPPSDVNLTFMPDSALGISYRLWVTYELGKRVLPWAIGLWLAVVLIRAA